MESNVNHRAWIRRKAKEKRLGAKRGQTAAGSLHGTAATQKKGRKRQRNEVQRTSVPSTVCSPLIVDVPAPAQSQGKRKRGKNKAKNKAKRARYQESATSVPFISTPLSSKPKSPRQSTKKDLQTRKNFVSQASPKAETSTSSAQDHLNTPSRAIVIDSGKETVSATSSDQVHLHSTPKNSTPGGRQIPLSPLHLQGGHLAVALIKARSPRLTKEDSYIGLFLRDSILCFQGCVQMRVLAGLVNVEGYIYKPSPHYHQLYSPVGNPTVSVSALNPDMQDVDFEPYLAPLRSQSGVHFHSCSESGCTTGGGGSRCVPVDLEREDIAVLEVMMKSAWDHTIAFVLFKSLYTNVTTLLHHCTSPSVFSVKSQLIDGFQTLPPKFVREIPPSFSRLAWDVLTHDGLSLLVCGSQGTGKSTLCRYLMNYLLNRHPSVCYLECDVGQPEFTIPEVLSLHIVSEPLTGPSYAHQRKAFRSYFYGDNSPRADPVYYIEILKTLYRDFTDVVRVSDPNIPLIVNTCGWTSGIGEGLLLDLIRSINPSHIIRLVGESSNEMPPFTEDLLTNRPGLVTQRKDFNLHQHGPHHCARPLFEFTGNDSGCSVDPSVDNPEESSETMDVSHNSTREVVEIQDSDEEAAKMSKEDTSHLSQSTGSSFSSTPVDRKLLKKIKGKKHLKGLLFYRRLLSKRAAKERREKEFGTEVWKSVLSHRVIYVYRDARKKQSSNLRKLALVAHLSPLLEAAVTVAMEYNMPNPHINMLCYAPPLQVPWKDVAVHILHRHVSRDQILYAFNGQFVALGSVAREEVIDPIPGSVKFLKSHTPIIEFIALGLLRGIDVEKKLFYLTTPEFSEELERVNVLVLGNTEKLPSFAKDAMQDNRAPYHLKGYQPAEGGQFAWSTKR